jgi:hypothetical protein
VGKFFFIYVLKTKLSKKTVLVSQRKNALNPQFNGLRQTPLYQLRSDAAIHSVLPDSQRTYFRKPIPADMERTHADQSIVFIIHVKIAEALIQFIQRPRQHLPRVCILIDERLYCSHIGFCRFAKHKKNYSVMQTKSTKKSGKETGNQYSVHFVAISGKTNDGTR